MPQSSEISAHVELSEAHVSKSKNAEHFKLLKEKERARSKAAAKEEQLKLDAMDDDERIAYLAAKEEANEHEKKVTHAQGAAWS